MAENKPNPETTPQTYAALLEQLPPQMVMGYFSGKAKKTDKPFTAIRVLTPCRSTSNGEGYDIKLLFLPEGERHKAQPGIIGKVVRCVTDIFGFQSDFEFCDA